jgi:hypothetical protein
MCIPWPALHIPRRGKIFSRGKVHIRADSLYKAEGSMYGFTNILYKMKGGPTHGTPDAGADDRRRASTIPEVVAAASAALSRAFVMAILAVETIQPEWIPIMADPVASARAAGLRYVSDTMPGFQRRRHGKGWTYLDVSGKPIRDSARRARAPAHRCGSCSGSSTPTSIGPSGIYEKRSKGASIQASPS